MNESEAQVAALAAYFARHSAVPLAAQRPALLFRPPAGLDAVAELRPGPCVQSHKPTAEALQQSGWQVLDAPRETCRLAIVFATKHKEEILHHLALAAEALEEGGSLILVAANTLGAPSLERRLGELTGRTETFSKHKCRVVRAFKADAQLNPALLADWKRGGELRRLPATGCYSCPGLFSWKSLDLGSRLLAARLPADLSGCGADLGAGYGYLAREALQCAPGIRELHLVEAEGKALAAAQLNLADVAGTRRLHYHWADVTAGLPLARLDFVLMNPPFHAGRAPLPALGRAFVREALRLLKPGGRLLLVANRQLPYEAEIRSMGGEIGSAEETQGFKIIQAIKVRQADAQARLST